MTDNEKGGAAFIAGNAALLVTMALHPTGEQLESNLSALALLNAVVHTLAIFAIPILFLAALALTRGIADDKRIAICALVFYAFALLAGMCAGAMSGYVAPDVLRRIARVTDPQSQQLWRVAFRYTGLLNQAFARILVVGSAVAIILWSSVIRSRGWRWYGIATNVVIAIVVIAGLLPLDVHGYGAVVLLQGVWFVGISLRMWRIVESAP